MGPSAEGPLLAWPSFLVLEHVVDVGRVPVRHTGEATYALDPEGGRWVRKREVNSGFQEVLAELISWQLAVRIGVRIPQAGLCCLAKAGERSWLTAYVDGAVHWDPAHAPFVENLAEMGAMLALDCLVINEDRHAGNILLQSTVDSMHLRAWAIDHGQAIVGRASDFAARCHELPSTRNHARGLPIEMMEEGAMTAATRANQIGGEEIRRFTRGACALSGCSDADVIAACLAERCSAAQDLVARYLEQVRSV